MAWVTWRYVETPFRHGKIRFFITRQGVFASSGVGLAAIAGLGAILSATDLTKIRYNRSLIGNLADVTNVYEFFDYNAVVRNKVCHSVDEESFRKNGCLDKRQKNILLWGDSYAAALYPGLEFYRNEKYQNVGITQLTDGNGPPFLRSDRTIDGGVRTLEEANTFRLKVAQDIQPDLIILTWYIGGSGSYGTPADDAKALEQLISRIRSFAPKARMVIVGPVPRWQGSLLKQVVGYSIARKQIPPQYISMGLGESEPVWDSFLKSYAWGKNVTYVSALSEMCRPDGTCLAHASDDVADLSAIDWGHLTRSGSVFLIGRLEAILFK